LAVGHSQGRPEEDLTTKEHIPRSPTLLRCGGAAKFGNPIEKKGGKKGEVLKIVRAAQNGKKTFKTWQTGGQCRLTEKDPTLGE